MAGRSTCFQIGRFVLGRLPNLGLLPECTEMSHRRWYAMKSPIPIKWVRPEKVSCIHPKKSGDLKPLQQVDTSQFPIEFRDLEELETADENVKKLFSLEFLPYKKTVETMRSNSVDTVKRHIFDINSAEVRLARMTVDIRDMQRFMENNPTDKRTKVRLKETIDKRKRLLKKLRMWDYKCFEWVLEKLDLVYKPYPPPDVYKRVERKRSIRMLTKQYCQDIVTGKLAEYRDSLNASKESFLEEKIKTLEWIMKEESACGVEPTVKQSDIEEGKKQLEAIRAAKEQAVAS